MGIFFPPCTYVTRAGQRWINAPDSYTPPLKGRPRLVAQRAALEFMRDLLECGIPKIALENPRGAFSTYWRKPDQVIHPHMFGHPEFKATCLWLENLPLLKPTRQLAIPERGTAEWVKWNKVHRMSPGENRARDRSETYSGVAYAMASQWGIV
jgi:hypothetical protein